VRSETPVDVVSRDPIISARVSNGVLLRFCFPFFTPSIGVIVRPLLVLTFSYLSLDTNLTPDRQKMFDDISAPDYAVLHI